MWKKKDQKKSNSEYSENSDALGEKVFLSKFFDMIATFFKIEMSSQLLYDSLSSVTYFHAFFKSKYFWSPETSCSVFLLYIFGDRMTRSGGAVILKVDF